MSKQDVIRLCQQEQSVDNYGYYSMAAVQKPLITEKKAHLRVWWCKNRRKKAIWSGESSFTIFTNGCAAYTRRTVQAWEFDLGSEGIWFSWRTGGHGLSDVLGTKLFLVITFIHYDNTSIHRGQMVWLRWIICCGLWSHQISNQVNHLNARAE